MQKSGLMWAIHYWEGYAVGYKKTVNELCWGIWEESNGLKIALSWFFVVHVIFNCREEVASNEVFNKD
jgi:hypothetical protein